jgi:UDPglucose 6-dehydrogenase
VKICIIGTGYVGLVTGVCFAERGHEVVCVDYDRSKVEAISRGLPPIHEAGLEELLRSNVGVRLRATTDLAEAMRLAEVVFVCVGTPFRDGAIDLSQIKAAAEQIGQVLRELSDYKLITMKSTVIPGTTNGMFRQTIETASGKQAGRDFGLAMNPEFLTEGTAVEDFRNPDRLVLGGIDERSRETLERLYESWPGVTRVPTNTTTAEMIKYASNSVLATMISFANEIGRLCTAVGGVDVTDVMRGVHHAAYFTSRSPGREPVVAPITSFLEAGCGFGGSCLPKDVSALVAQGQAQGLEMPLLRSVLDINRSQPDELMKIIGRHRSKLAGARIAVLGIAFKPDTDDVRESPAFPILKRLQAAGCQVTAYDPVARPQDPALLAGARLAASLEEAIKDAEVIIIVTRWAQFRDVPQLLKSLDHPPLVVDGRRMLSPSLVPHYTGIGL